MTMRLDTGNKKAYRRDGKPSGKGAYASVYRAEHRETGEVVALKVLHDTLGDAVQRMSREIGVMQTLLGTPGIMEILDADPNRAWYVMPFADGDLKKLREQLTDEDLLSAARGVASGLHAAHQAGFVHRDVTPTNVLRLGSGEWVVADWGVVRRELGQTTRRLTDVANPLGTDGFIAPECLRNAHTEPSPAADVFSLGQVMGYAVTGVWPLAGDRKPPTGPWRAWVRDCIREQPEDRPTIPELVDRLQEVGYTPDTTPIERAEDLAAAADTGDQDAAWRLIELADAHHDDAEIFFDHLPHARGPVLNRLVADPAMAERLVSTLCSWLEDGQAWDRRDFDRYNWVLAWIRDVAQAAAADGRLDVLEDTAEQVFAANVRLDRFRERGRIRDWISSLQGEAAHTVARALRRQPEAAVWLAGNDPPRGIDPTLADALRPAPRSSRPVDSLPAQSAAAVWGPGEGGASGPFNLHGTGSPFNAQVRNLSGKDQMITRAKLITDIGVFEAARGESGQDGEEELPIRVPVGRPGRVSFHSPELAGLSQGQGGRLELEVDSAAADGTGPAHRYYLTLLRRNTSPQGRPQWAAKGERAVMLG